ncbi:hypothetical protein cypCar_00035026 [Cyprinus carpio]|nr:hypothetical protein cypCar_00035026 [Cyprinus carpio]
MTQAILNTVSVGGEVNDIATVKVMEGGVLNLHPGLEDLKGDVQIMWTFESGRENTRVAQMHQGRIYTHYDMRFTGRVQLDQRTGILTIMDIRTNESGLYEALIVISAGITGRRYKVHVYGKSQETEETCSLVCSVKNDRDVSGSVRTSCYSCEFTVNIYDCPFHMRRLAHDRKDHCGVTEALVRLVLSGLAGIATVGFLIEHLIFCSAQKRTAASVC